MTKQRLSKTKREAVKRMMKLKGFTMAGLTGGGFQEKTLVLIGQVQKIIGEYQMPLTLRQIYYRLVAGQIIENKQSEYKRLAGILSKARKANYIDMDSIVDRTRIPIKHGSWNDIKEFLETVQQSYLKNKRTEQDEYLEVWIEKDALSGVFEPITNAYDVYLIVGRGYPSLSCLNEASKRFNHSGKDNFRILYFGDFDPTGEDIPRSIEQELTNTFGITTLNLEKVALTSGQVQEHDLPPAPTKSTDPRSKGFIAEHGDRAVELDALPPDTLQDMIGANIERYLNREQFDKDVATEKRETKKLNKMIEQIKL